MGQHQSRIRRLERRYRAHTRADDDATVPIPDDPVAFARLLGFEPDPWQRDLLFSTDKRVLLNCCRQSGKTTSVAVLALHHALIHLKSLVLIFSPSERQSKEFLKKIQDYYGELGSPGGSLTNSASTLELTNRSRIVALPSSGATVRGFSAPSLVLVDEAAQIDEELYHAVVPMLIVSQGRLILLSTPFGKRGFFWHAWEFEAGWEKFKITADGCPRITQADVEDARHALAESVFRQEYYCEFVQDESCTFKEGWIQHFDPATIGEMDVVVQSWDTAQTKSAASDYVVGQVWGRRGADFYLLDQVRDKMDFDEIVANMKSVSETWPESAAVLVEAQSLGAALATHLKAEIPGIIPIYVKDAKEQRAINTMPAWRSGNVHVPKLDDPGRPWVRDYVWELTNFPTAAHDDQVDATSLALNQLRGSLFPNIKAVAKPIEEKGVYRGHEYLIGWIPARSDNEYTLVVYDRKTSEVVRFYRAPARPFEEQIKTVYLTSVAWSRAVVRVFVGADESIVNAAELKGTWVEKVKLTQAKEDAAYENLSQLIDNFLIDIPKYPGLMAELTVFKSAFTYDERADYSLQRAQQSGIRALVLVTHDLAPTHWNYEPDIYIGFDPDRLRPDWSASFSRKGPYPY